MIGTAGFHSASALTNMKALHPAYSRGVVASALPCEPNSSPPPGWTKMLNAYRYTCACIRPLSIYVSAVCVCVCVNLFANITMDPAVQARATQVMAHIGDSRAILCRAGQAVQITEDHKPDRIDEKKLGTAPDPTTPSPRSS